MLVKIIKIGFEAGWEPQEIETKGWKINDVVELSNATVQISKGLVIPVDVDGNELSPPPTMPTPEGGLKTSAREYFNSLLNKTHKKDAEKFSQAIDTEFDEALSHLARLSMLMTAKKIEGYKKREYFLDHLAIDFMRSVKGTSRLELLDMVDQKASEVSRLPGTITSY